MRLIVLPMLAFLLVTACSDGKKPPLGIPPEITVSGRITYARVPLLVTGDEPALDYAGETTLPCRGVPVEVVLANGEVYARDLTDDDGRYEALAPSAARITVRAISQLGVGANITQATNGSALYNIGTDLTTDEAAMTVDLHAPSGWTGSSYGAARLAAPFAIIDTIRDCQDRVREVAPDTAFPYLKVVWTTATNRSFFLASTATLSISGVANADTDEYDRHVVAHEWGHYFTHSFSVDDSLGGPHTSDDILDETLAYSEGLANALSGVLLEDPIYSDTLGTNQGGAGSFSIDMEQDLFPASATEPIPTNSTLNNTGAVIDLRTDGVHNETSVAQLVWDLVDDGSETGDGVDIAWSGLHEVLTSNTFRSYAPFTCITRLLAEVEARFPAQAAAVRTLAAAEAIGDGGAGSYDHFEDARHQLGLRYARFGVANTGPSVRITDGAGRVLATHAQFGSINLATNAANYLYHQQRFAVTAAQAGAVRLTITPAANGIDTVLILPDQIVESTRGNAGVADAFVFQDVVAGQVLIFAVTTAVGAGAFTISLAYEPST